MNPRFYLQDALTPHTEIFLSASAYNHLQALRCKVGDMLTLFDGQGREISAHIIEINKKAAKVLLQNDLSLQTPSALKLHLGQALCRFDRMDVILQKAVELNVNEITPLYAERSQGRLKGVALERKMAHWQEILISACEQCQQNYLPVLHEPMMVSEWLNSVDAEVKLQFVLDNALSLKTCQSTPHSFALLIGPEGGFTEAEVLLADQKNFLRITLGNRILRVETAAILALGLVNYQFSD